MTRFWNKGAPITMQTTPNGDPTRFTWDNQSHQVTAITRRWRVDTDWWRSRIWRAYFKLSTNTGLLLIVYCDLGDGQWYVQRMYD